MNKIHKKIIFILGGLWLTFIGLRMITQWLIDPNAIMYPPNPIGDTWATWDFWFDWFPMVIFGILIIYITLKDTKKGINTENEISG